jgi:hypothetical protein
MGLNHPAGPPSPGRASITRPGLNHPAGPPSIWTASFAPFSLSPPSPGRRSTSTWRRRLDPAPLCAAGPRGRTRPSAPGPACWRAHGVLPLPGQACGGTTTAQGFTTRAHGTRMAGPGRLLSEAWCPCGAWRLGPRAWARPGPCRARRAIPPRGHNSVVVRPSNGAGHWSGPLECRARAWPETAEAAACVAAPTGSGAGSGATTLCHYPKA